jgi:hypothetical protein
MCGIYLKNAQALPHITVKGWFSVVGMGVIIIGGTSMNQFVNIVVLSFFLTNISALKMSTCKWYKILI